MTSEPLRIVVAEDSPTARRLLVEILRADPDTRHIPIVMVSARAQGSDLARGQEVGVDAYLTKPFEPEELVATVRYLVADGGRGR